MAADEALEAYLLARLGQADARERVAHLPLSRRAFLGGIMATPAAATSAFAAGAPPMLHRAGSTLTLAYGGERWTLDRAAFGPRAILRARRVRDGHVIDLERATLPGINFPLSLQLRLLRGSRGWAVQASAPSLGLAGQMPLGQWLSGEPLRGRMRAMRMAAGSGELRVGPGALELSSRSGLTVRLLGKASMSGRVQAEGDAVALRLAPADPALWQDGDGPRWATRFTVERPRVGRRAFACGDGASMVALQAGGISSLEGEFADQHGARHDVALIEGPAQLDMRRGGAAATPLKFDHAVLAVARDRLGISGRISEMPFVGDGGHCVAAYHGDAALPFAASFRAGETPHFEASVKASRIWVPVEGADSAVLDLAGLPMTLATAPSPARPFERIIIGDQPAIIARLDQTTLDLRSSAHLLDLRFKFSGFHFEWTALGGPFIERDLSGNTCLAGTIEVELPPQHRSEELQELNGDTSCVPAGSDGSQAGLLFRRSRIVFTLPPARRSEAPWARVPLNVAALTDWSRLTMAVDPRAASTVLDNDLQSQLDVVKIGHGDDMGTALDKIARTIKLPADTHTALELAESLVFSPAENVVWERTDIGSGTHVPLFGLRIGRDGDPRLRALGSRLLPGGIPTDDQLPTKAGAFSALSADDHWQIIGQTSTYGLPALRRLLPDKTDERPTPGDGPRPAEAPAPDETKDEALKRVPRSGVIRPAEGKDDYAYLQEIDQFLDPKAKPPSREVGIALASPFDTADVTLTSLGATMRLDWRGEPAQLRWDPKVRARPTSFSLQRLAYQAWLGRDVRVIAVNKGYLLPFGMPASLIEVAERVFLPDGMGKPVGKEIRRRFITASAEKKSFPAVNQPDAGRDFPASSLRLLTTRTPDLISPDDPNGGAIDPKFAEWAFWPRIYGAGHVPADFEWKTSVDDDPTPLVNNMLFVRIDAAGNQEFMARVIAAYNGKLRDAAGPGPRANWPARNVARLGGARRTYAPPLETAPQMRGQARADSAEALPPADTAYDTDSWLLVARGRSSGPDAPENYVLDARMLGKDQPPFYPSLLRAAINVQGIDRLVGTPQGLIETRPYGPYVREGMDAVKNAGGIFLEVMHPVIALDVGKAGKPATGGVAQPGTKVAGLSRISGVVGGKTRGNLTAGEPQLDFGRAADGKFEPSDFFELKLFGIDLLKAIAGSDLDFSQAPRLTEIVNHGLGDNRDLNRAIKDAAKRALERINGTPGTTGLLQGLDSSIAAFDRQINQPGVTFRTLYPKLFDAYQGAKTSLLKELTSIANNGDLAQVSAAAMRFSAAAKPLIREIGQAARDPVPPAINDALASIIGDWKTFLATLEGLQSDLQRDVRKLVEDQLRALTALGADQLALLFGLRSGQTLIDLARDPEARARLGETLLFEHLGAPILSMLESVDRFSSDLAGAVTLRWAALRAAAEDAIHEQIGALAGQIVEDSSALNNILREADAERLASALADAAVAEVRRLTDVPDLHQALARLQQVADEFTNQGDAYRSLAAKLQETVERHRDWLRTPDPAQQQALFDAFARALVAAVLARALQEAQPRIAEVTKLVTALLNQGIDAIVEIALKALNATLEGASRLRQLADVARLGRAINNWCTDTVDGALGVVRVLGSALLAPQPAIDAALADIAAQINAFQPPQTTPADIADRLARIRLALVAAVQAAAQASATLAAARHEIETIDAGLTCATTAAFATALQTCVRARAEAVASLRGVALQVRALSQLVADAPPDFRAAARTYLDTIVRATRALIAGISIAGEAGLAGVWNDQVKPARDQLLARIGVADFQDRLRTSYNDIVTAAASLRQALNTATADALVDMVERAVALADPDRRLAGLIIETVALGDEARGRVENAAFLLITGAARALYALHATALVPLKALSDLGTRRPEIAYLLDGFPDFQRSVGEVETDAGLLQAVAAASNFADARTRLDALIAAWSSVKSIALSRAAAELVRYVDTILKGKFGKLLGQLVRDKFAELERELREMIAAFVPAAIQTRYDWTTPLKPFASALVTFSMRPPQPTDNDLTLRTVSDFNFITGKRNVVVEGTLKPFDIGIPNWFTIQFNGATFTSVNGSSPDLKAQVSNVVLGPALTFLEQIGKVLGPSGNGLYVTPRFDGIRVGYGFARDRLPVGSLMLSNIALDVYADLPFGNTPAEFGFRFASAERPFLISQPPYGGGGWVALTFGGVEGTRVGLSFMFGAVTDIKFGPLSGHGRICVGITWTNTSLTTFIEAVGEGNIACFSISIYIGFFLIHQNNGALYGEARYSYKFKIGFASLHYSVTARRTIQGPRGGGSGGMASEPAGGLLAVASLVSTANLTAPPALALAEATHRHQTRVPRKSTQWRAYSGKVSLELLDV